MNITNEFEQCFYEFKNKLKALDKLSASSQAMFDAEIAINILIKTLEDELNEKND